MDKRQAVIALGSNLGNGTATLTAAAARIAAAPGITQRALSSIVTSKPAVIAEQPNFSNAVMLVETDFSPLDLLSVLHEIETEFGRVREGSDYIPYGPRTLDLDIIDYEGVVQDTPELVLPHPQALRRDFVVSPLLEISPNHVLANAKVVNHSAVDCGEIFREDNGGSQEENVSACEGSAGTQEENVSARKNSGDSQEENVSACKNSGDTQEENLPARKGNAENKASKKGLLSVCATPIGNLGDITLRVLQTLQDADIIYCEDTRVTRKLTSRYDITTPLRRGDAHKLPQLLPQIVNELEAGHLLAFVSDAGMPGISDPGGLLVTSVRQAGYPVEVLPGASALTTALAASGIKARSHFFGGFFPRKVGAATRLLKELESLEDTVLVFYESVHRTAKTLKLIAELWPSRRVVMARELTKLHEELLDGTAAEVAQIIDERVSVGRPLKGEIVLLIAPF